VADKVIGVGGQAPRVVASKAVAGTPMPNSTHRAGRQQVVGTLVAAFLTLALAARTGRRRARERRMRARIAQHGAL